MVEAQNLEKWDQLLPSVFSPGEVGGQGKKILPLRPHRRLSAGFVRHSQEQGGWQCLSEGIS